MQVYQLKIYASNILILKTKRKVIFHFDNENKREQIYLKN